MSWRPFFKRLSPPKQYNKLVTDVNRVKSMVNNMTIDASMSKIAFGVSRFRYGQFYTQKVYYYGMEVSLGF
jgi:hypothetical protein